jgi:hypothetical protein
MQATNAAPAAGTVSNVIARSPALIFFLVAAADGKVDKKEVTMFQKLIGGEKYGVLLTLMRQSGASLPEMLMQVQSEGRNVMEHLAELNSHIDAAFPAQAAHGLKLRLLGFAQAIAESSGGFLGMFGSKVSDEEKTALTMIAHCFGLLGEAAGQPAQEQDTGSLNTVPENLYPLLKPGAWAREVAGKVVVRTIQDDNRIHADDPVVAYAIDANETVEVVGPDRLGQEVSAETLHATAIRNLETRLAHSGAWHTLSADLSEQGGGKVEGLVYTGDYYCAEAIVSEKTLKQAHEKLDAAFLMVAAPARGVLYATSAVDPDNVEPAGLGFMSFAIKPYFMGHDAPIAPTIWLSRNGKIVGHLSGAEAVIEIARKAAEAERASEDDKLQCQTSRVGDENQFGIRMDVVVKDLDVMLKNLQHLIRNNAMQVHEDDHFNGQIHVDLTVEDPQYSTEHEHVLKQAMDEMFGFLTNQIESIYQRVQMGRGITLSYDIVR